MRNVTINVRHKKPNRVLIWFSMFLFWAMLVGSVGVSRAWFGEAFVIEFMAMVLSIMMLISLARTFAGYDVTLTVDETRRWIAAGANPDVKAWKEANT